MTLVGIKDNKVVIREPKIPELEREKVSSDDAGIVRGFLDWLFEEWMAEQEEAGKDTWDIRLNQLSRPQLLHAYFDLDEDKLESERRKILVCVRIHNADRDLRKDKKVQAMKEADRELYIHGQLREVERAERKELGVRT